MDSAPLPILTAAAESRLAMIDEAVMSSQLMALYLTVKFECLLLQAVQGSPVQHHSR